MKSMSISLALLTVVPAHGFLTSPSLGASTVRASRGCITQWQSQRQRLIRHESKSTSLTMTNNFSKTVAAVALAALTIGASAIPFMFMGPESDGPKIIRVVDEDGNVSERGALTAMTRAEIQKKLSQVPVFFLRDESGAVHVDGEEGLLFMSPEDAKDKLEELKGADGAKVAATTLDDVWFPLLKKKGLNKKPVAAQASVASDLSARYRLVPRQKQTAQALETAGWKTINDEDGVPVWAADSLAFRGTGSKYKMPLFTNVEDVVTSWERLKTEAGSTANGPTIQVSTIGAIVDMMEKGGADIRNLEFFADMEAMEQAEQLSL